MIALIFLYYFWKNYVYNRSLKSKGIMLIFGFIGLFFLNLFSLHAQGIVTNKDAQEEFKWALNSYNNGIYDDALLSFKKF